MFKYILGCDLSQGSIHLSAEPSSREARQRLPTRSTLSTRIIPLTMWSALRTGRQMPLGHCSRQPSSCPTTDRAAFHKWNERRQQDNKSRTQSWQVWRCCLELQLPFPKTSENRGKGRELQVFRLAFVWGQHNLTTCNWSSQSEVSATDEPLACSGAGTALSPIEQVDFHHFLGPRCSVLCFATVPCLQQLLYLLPFNSGSFPATSAASPMAPSASTVARSYSSSLSIEMRMSSSLKARDLGWNKSNRKSSQKQKIMHLSSSISSQIHMTPRWCYRRLGSWGWMYISESLITDR